MKTFVRLALISAALAALPAQAYVLTNTAGVFTSEAGAVTFATFDALDVAAIGTASGGLTNSGADPGGGGNWRSAGNNLVVTVNFANLTDYFGLLWGTNDGSQNVIDLYAGATLVGSINGNAVTGFTNIYASNAAEFFDSAVLRATFSGCCFEFDNFAARGVPEPAPIALVGAALFALGLSRRRWV